MYSYKTIIMMLLGVQVCLIMLLWWKLPMLTFHDSMKGPFQRNSNFKQIPKVLSNGNGGQSPPRHVKQEQENHHQQQIDTSRTSVKPGNTRIEEYFPQEVRQWIENPLISPHYHEDYYNEHVVHDAKITILAKEKTWLVAGWPVSNCSIGCYFDRKAGKTNAQLAEADAIIYHKVGAPSIDDTTQINMVFASESDTHPMHRGYRANIMETLGKNIDLALTYHDTTDPAILNHLEMGRKFSNFRITYAGDKHETVLFSQPPRVPVENRRKDYLAVLFMSNCGSPQRNEIIKELQKHVTIGSYGKCMNNVKEKDESCHSSDWRQRKLCVLSQYKFYLAFENSVDYSYITEKFYQGLMVGVIPVYLGAPNAKDFLPTFGSSAKSMLFVNDYPSVSELGKHMSFLASHDDEYRKYLEWKSLPLIPTFQNIIDYGLDWQYTMCKLCKVIYVLRENKRKRLLLFQIK